MHWINGLWKLLFSYNYGSGDLLKALFEKSMKYQRLITVIFILIISAIPALAQDLIVKKGGEIVQSRVIEVGIDEITYKRYDNLSGPIYKILKSSVYSIRYENGIVEMFDDEQPSGDDEYSERNKEIIARVDDPVYLNLSEEDKPNFFRDAELLISLGIGTGRVVHSREVHQPNIQTVSFPETVLKIELAGKDNFSFGIMSGFNSVMEENMASHRYGYINYFISAITTYHIDTDSKLFPYISLGAGISGWNALQSEEFIYPGPNNRMISFYSTGIIGFKYMASDNIGVFVDTRIGYPVHAIGQLGVSFSFN
ncbi:MAG: hypothetical protein ACNS60_06580 [Candidatus Cyclobacteriaceae bacterium M2_1C_046]